MRKMKEMTVLLVTLAMVLVMLPTATFAEVLSENTYTPICICETKCSANSINTDCPVCSMESADLALCTGTTATPTVTPKQSEISPVVTEVQVLNNAPPVLTQANALISTNVKVNGVELTTDRPYLASNNTAAVAQKPIGGYAYYDSGTNTLELNNYTNKNGAASPIVEAKIRAAIYANGDLTIKLVNEDTSVKIKDAAGQSSGTPEPSDKSACIYVKGALTITGSGSATFNAGASWKASDDHYNYGIYANSVVVNATGILQVNTAPKVADAQQGVAHCYGIYSEESQEFKTGSKVTANSIDSNFVNFGGELYGIYAGGQITIEDDANVTAGNQFGANKPCSIAYGIYARGNISILGELSASTRNNVFGENCAVYGENTLTIDGNAKVTANGLQSTSGESYGIYGRNNVNIVGKSTVKATNVLSNDTDGCVIRGTTITLADKAKFELKSSNNSGSSLVPRVIHATTQLNMPPKTTITGGYKDNQSVYQSTETATVMLDCDESIKVTFDPCNGEAPAVIKRSEK